MIPKIQIDDQVSEQIGSPMLYLTNANELISLSLDDVKKSKPLTDFSSLISHPNSSKYFKYANLNSKKMNFGFQNQISPIDVFKFYENHDIKDFKKKDDIIATFSE